MKLLLTNDDGIQSEGILALARRLSVKHEVLVVAPSFNQSAKGHSATFHEISYTDRGKEGGAHCYALDGTPSDCTRFAIGFLGFRPDLVISGINDGMNIAYDVWLSGTVGAAMEANFFSIPSLAVSVYYNRNRDKKDFTFTYALDYIESRLDFLYDMIKGKSVTLNVNVPMKKWLGERICPLADSIYTALYEKKEDKLNVQLWQDLTPERFYGTDIYYVEKGYVSITPLNINPTDRELIATWNKTT